MEKLIQLTDFLSRKSMFPVLRKALNLLFCASITSFIFEKAYFEYYWLEFTDYKGILNFFIKGGFIVPFSIFSLVYIFTYLFPYMLFSISNYFKNIKWQKKLLTKDVAEDQAVKQYNKFRATVEDKTAQRFSNKAMINLYNYLKKRLNQKQYNKIQRELQKLQVNIEANFILSFRAIITILIYFITLEYFDSLLFTIVIIVLIIYMFFLILAFRILEILPTIFRKLILEAEKYIKKYENDSTKQ